MKRGRSLNYFRRIAVDNCVSLFFGVINQNATEYVHHPMCRYYFTAEM